MKKEYIIKNVKSGKYLTMNSGTLNASQSNFTEKSSQQWVFKVDNLALIYYLQSADGDGTINSSDASSILVSLK